MTTLGVPKHIVSVSALVRNDKGEVLLVRTQHRADTWEMPGGQVEVGEPLDAAVCRELLEETGIVIRPVGITGIYYNATKYVLNVVFQADCIGGYMAPQPGEIAEVDFIALDESNISRYITRPQQRSRTLDALRAEAHIPYETWLTSPVYTLIGRMDGTAGPR